MPTGWKRTWVKFWVNECIDGSLREQLEPDERGVWYDLILLSARGRVAGEIASNESEPMSHKRIAGILNIPEKLLERTLDKCLEQKRILITSEGIIKIVNWEKYQSEYQRQKPYRKKDLRRIPGETKEEFEERLALFQEPTHPELTDGELLTQSDLTVRKVMSYHDGGIR